MGLSSTMGLSSIVFSLGLLYAGGALFLLLFALWLSVTVYFYLLHRRFAHGLLSVLRMGHYTGSNIWARWGLGTRLPGTSTCELVNFSPYFRLSASEQIPSSPGRSQSWGYSSWWCLLQASIPTGNSGSYWQSDCHISPSAQVWCPSKVVYVTWLQML